MDFFQGSLDYKIKADIQEMKRRHESPTEEDDENEIALIIELERKARVLQISKPGTNITKVPPQQAGFRRRNVQKEDQFESLLVFSDSENVETEVREVCHVLNGCDPEADLDKYVGGRSIENVRRALDFAYRELNEVLIDGIDQLIDGAIELGINVDEEEFHALRNNVFHEDNHNKFMTDLEELGMPQAVHLVMKGRCEVAWAKDNRDRLVDYIEEAKAIGEVDGTHELQFEFYPRATNTELMGDQERDRVRTGKGEQDLLTSAEIQDGIESPTKRKKSAWDTDAPQGAASSADAEHVGDDEMQD